jgi:hypothetical protein
MHEIPAATSEFAGALEALVAYLAVRDDPRYADVIVGLGTDSADVADQADPLTTPATALPARPVDRR